MISKILKFSDYRIEYAKEITVSMNDLRYTERELEYLLLRMYSSYLIICGFKEIADVVYSHNNKLSSFKDGILNEDWDEEFEKNINKEVEKIVELELKRIDK